MFLLFMVFLSVSFFFKKKMIVLLILEAGMVLCVFFCFTNFSFISYSFFFLMLLSIFMVLESVFNLSSLIMTSRDSTKFNLSFFFF
uniref:NADH dehydrogenase subunit 4L n=1 Tax=Rhinotergum shaoguanense TaxID=1452699 RepID=A0A1S5XVX2_9ACAR|nr:NADH dehydrogenase subunit 4L [Rhinotergum shaoguanense]AQQ72854.1 NADH dehydrogenase subunit 4L [Rhinotergum shaoguanense]